MKRITFIQSIQISTVECLSAWTIPANRWMPGRSAHFIHIIREAAKPGVCNELIEQSKQTVFWSSVMEQNSSNDRKPILLQENSALNNFCNSREIHCTWGPLRLFPVKISPTNGESTKTLEVPEDPSQILLMALSLFSFRTWFQNADQRSCGVEITTPLVAGTQDRYGGPLRIWGHLHKTRVTVWVESRAQSRAAPACHGSPTLNHCLGGNNCLDAATFAQVSFGEIFPASPSKQCMKTLGSSHYNLCFPPFGEMPCSWIYWSISIGFSDWNIALW